MKNSYRTFLVFLYFLIYALTSLGQNHSFTDKYDLNFDFQKNKNTSWIADPVFPFNISKDTSQTINSKNPLSFVQKKHEPVLYATMLQKILLPKTKADSITVSLRCESKNLQMARIIISGITDREVVLYSDTLLALRLDGWHTFSRSVSKRDVSFLHLNIQAMGIERPSVQRFNIDKIELKLDGKDINEFPFTTIPNLPDIIKSDIISLSSTDKDSYKKIPELENRKIVAIGETIHGSETINETAVQLIKYRVENNHCKLILLEIPLEQTFQINRFIQGDTLFKIEDFTKDLSALLYSPKVMIELLNWLKKYNANRNDKVWLWGMDMYISHTHSANTLFEYIDNINKKRSVLLDSLCLQLYNYNSFPKALQFIERHSEIDKLLGKTEYEIFHYCLKMSIFNSEDSRILFLKRDNQMLSKTTFLLNLLCPDNENATIYTHFLHANYISFNSSHPFRKSFGSYMHNKFGKDYYTIAVLTGKGNFISGDKDSLFIKRRLEISPENSMENLFMRTNEELCFIPISILPSQLTYIRAVGNQFMENQFSIIAPASRMDAAIFVRTSKEFEILGGTLTSAKDIINFEYEQILENKKKYLHIQNRIK